MPTEDEFVANAITFLKEIGAETADVHADTDLFAAEVLDSLGTLAFLDFLEEQRGEEIEIATLRIEALSTLRKAHGFVFARSVSAAGDGPGTRTAVPHHP
ncbi:phosphopantetheine-binding protein [Streptomyces sp. NBC_00250]|uniref:phosphopantetheine-binding protein n=1 Tax=Streptomyces sp. NBC_00250 TaxID=2903641 RepID=UPI002E2CB663|nr:phosphopantetheine-binding protein [Streptomyces sp. NBC_00250]